MDALPWRDDCCWCLTLDGSLLLNVPFSVNRAAVGSTCTRRCRRWGSGITTWPKTWCHCRTSEMPLRMALTETRRICHQELGELWRTDPVTVCEGFCPELWENPKGPNLVCSHRQTDMQTWGSCGLIECSGKDDVTMWTRWGCCLALIMWTKQLPFRCKEVTDWLYVLYKMLKCEQGKLVALNLGSWRTGRWSPLEKTLQGQGHWSSRLETAVEDYCACCKGCCKGKGNEDELSRLGGATEGQAPVCCRGML